MSNLNEVRKELASAMASAGWTIYHQIPSGADVRFPCAIIEPEQVTYEKTKGGRIYATYSISFLTVAAHSTTAQEYVDLALSYGTANSIPSALTEYSYETLSQIRITQATEFGTYTPNTVTAYGAKLTIEVITS